MKNPRLLSCTRTARPPARPRPYRKSSIISLGRAIVALYLITLLTAVISARTLAENELGQPGPRGVETQETEPSIAGG